MNSHNIKTEQVVKNESARIDSDDESVRVVRADLVEEPELTVADDFNLGGDPYNSTGRHVIITPKNDQED